MFHSEVAAEEGEAKQKDVDSGLDHAMDDLHRADNLRLSVHQCRCLVSFRVLAFHLTASLPFSDCNHTARLYAR